MGKSRGQGGRWWLGASGAGRRPRRHPCQRITCLFSPRRLSAGECHATRWQGSSPKRLGSRALWAMAPAPADGAGSVAKRSAGLVRGHCGPEALRCSCLRTGNGTESPSRTYVHGGPVAPAWHRSRCVSPARPPRRGESPRRIRGTLSTGGISHRCCPAPATISPNWPSYPGF